RDSLLDLLDLLLPDPAEPVERAVGDGGGKLVDGGDVPLLPEHADGLGPEAGDAEHVDEPLGDAGGQFVVVGAGAGFEPVADDLGAGSADAVDLLDSLAPPLAVDGADVLWHVL